MTSVSTSPITATLKPIGEGLRKRFVPYGDWPPQWLARCGCCGYALWTVSQGFDGESAWFIVSQTMGYVFAQDTRTWHPTERYLAQLAHARAKVSAGTATDDERRLLTTGSGFVGRRGGEPHAPWITSATRADAMRLPLTIVCPVCGAPNFVEKPAARNH
jgi:hypothetical protein